MAIKVPTLAIECADISGGVLPGDGRSVALLSEYLANNGVFNPYDFKVTGLESGDVLMQRAVDAARTAGGVLEIPPGLVVTAPIDMTRASADSAATHRSIVVRMKSQSTFGSPTSPGLQVMHNEYAVFDCTGSSAFIWENVNVGTVSGYAPKCCWLFARNAAKEGCGDHQLDNCRGFGEYSVALIYSYGAEVNTYRDCRFLNSATTPVIFKSTATNVDTIASDFITIATGNVSNIVTFFEGGEFWALAAGGVIFHLEQHESFSAKNFWYIAGDGGSGHGHSLCYVDQTNGTSDRLHIDGAIGEAASLPQYGVCLSDPGVSRSPAFCRIANSRIGTTTNVIKGGGADTRCFDWTIENIDENGAGVGCDFPGTLDTVSWDAQIKLNVVTLVNPKVMRIPQSWLTVAQFRGGQFAFEEGNLQINGQTLAAGLVGDGGTGVFALGIGTQPDAVGTLAQFYQDAAGNVWCITSAGNKRPIAAV